MPISKSSVFPYFSSASYTQQHIPINNKTKSYFVSLFLRCRAKVFVSIKVISQINNIYLFCYWKEKKDGTYRSWHHAKEFWIHTIYIYKLPARLYPQLFEELVREIKMHITHPSINTSSINCSHQDKCFKLVISVCLEMNNMTARGKQTAGQILFKDRSNSLMDKENCICFWKSNFHCSLEFENHNQHYLRRLNACYSLTKKTYIQCYIANHSLKLQRVA